MHSTNHHPALSTPFSVRAESPDVAPLAQYLLSLISIKRSNLCVSADVHTTYDLLTLAEEVGDSICILKTHADIIDDFSKDTILQLQDISKRKKFLLFEDRKFGDIGNTVQSQYTRGPLAIATWAHLTNAHLLPGPSIIPSLHTAAQSTLTSLNQSVATTISAGTPRVSLESNSSTDPPKRAINAIQEANAEASTSASSTPIDIPAREPNPEKGEDNVLFSHHRNHGQRAYATTTVTQSFEPTSPSHPPSLLKTLSVQSAESPEITAHNLEELGGPPHARGLLILAQMSSEGNMMTAEYTAACIDAARQNRDFVVGFVAQKNLNSESKDAFLTFTPGVGLPPEGAIHDEGARGDGKGQVWRTPKEVIARDGADIVIVGRGILGADDRGKEAERYRKGAWEAYESRIGRK